MKEREIRVRASQVAQIAAGICVNVLNLGLDGDEDQANMVAAIDDLLDEAAELVERLHELAPSTSALRETLVAAAAEWDSAKARGERSRPRE
ncbi:MAG TPA: hypothetical protein VG248_17465 [Caulobacteraceae bacterium]|nr:hypothetical protein [Caulobacteraceae bacterium]